MVILLRRDLLVILYCFDWFFVICILFILFSHFDKMLDNIAIVKFAQVKNQIDSPQHGLHLALSINLFHLSLVSIHKKQPPHNQMTKILRIHLINTLPIKFSIPLIIIAESFQSMGLLLVLLVVKGEVGQVLLLLQVDLEL
jgi:hypothetical protein